jgi:hypothetical protein
METGGMTAEALTGGFTGDLTGGFDGDFGGEKRFAANAQ